MLSATLFDFNGVLVDDEHLHLSAFQEVFRPVGIAVDEQTYADRYLGFDDAGAFRAILRDHGREPAQAELEDWIERKRLVYKRMASERLVVFEGAERLVDECAAFGPVGIVSGALREEIEFALELMRVRERIAFVVSAEDAPHCKPDPQGYLLGYERLSGLVENLTPAQVVAIEDSLAGVRAARGASLRCVAVAHSYPEAELRSAGAEHVAQRLIELTSGALSGLFEPSHVGRGR